MADNNVEIILIGETGVDKSSLGNFILGKKVFETSNNPCCETLNIELKNVNCLTIIDTPGINDFYDYYNNNGIENIVKYIKNMKWVTVILFLLNSCSTRLTNDLQNTIKILYKAFDYSVLKNMAFVFSKFHGKKEKNQK